MATSQPGPGRTIHFGDFELDLRAGELRKGACRLKLQDRPLQVLQLLLEHPGEVVTREELRQSLWSSDTFVDFDHGLNNAIRRLREALDDSADLPRFIETIPRHGYRFIASVGSTVRPITSVAVLPLENLSRDPDQEYLADGFTEALITSLAKIGALRVVSRTSAMYYKGVHRSLPEIAAELKVDGIIEGTVIRSGDKVRISVQLIHGPSDTHLWAEMYDRDARDVLALQSDLARAVAREIQVKLTAQEHAHLEQTTRVDPAAYEFYLKGRYYWNKRTAEGLRKGHEFFEQAIRVDPSYANAYAGLADIAAVLGWWGFLPPHKTFVKAKDAARKALSIDETLAEPHACLGFSLQHYDHDFAGADREFKRSIELNPHYATASQWYGACLCALGRFDEAIDVMRRSERDDPVSVIIKWTTSHIFFHARRFEEAVREARLAVELDANLPMARMVLGISCEMLGDHESAITELTQAVRLSRQSPLQLALLARTLVLAGQAEQGRQILQDLTSPAQNSYVMAYWMALIYSALHERDEAFRWLDVAFEERSAWLTYLKVDPRFDNLRGDPRFAERVSRINYAT